jgi:perosamine synthetase
LYYKCALLRNHAEAVINSMPENMQLVYEKMPKQYGFNMRMTEIQACILLSQFNEMHYIDGHIDDYILNIEIWNRRDRVEKLTKAINLPFIKWCQDRPDCQHSYYVLPFLFDSKIAGISRNRFIEAIKAELRIEKTDMGITQKIDPLIWEGYIKPIYRMPIFKNRLIENLPVVEELQDETFCFTTFQGLPLRNADIDDIANAFHKVAENIKELK